MDVQNFSWRACVKPATLPHLVGRIVEAIFPFLVAPNPAPKLVDDHLYSKPEYRTGPETEAIQLSSGQLARSTRFGVIRAEAFLQIFGCGAKGSASFFGFVLCFEGATLSEISTAEVC